MARRSYGTGQLSPAPTPRPGVVVPGWYIGTKRIKRTIGPKRQPGSCDGLTRAQADASCGAGWTPSVRCQ